MKVVVDTNIVFSTLLNTTGNFGKILVSYGSQFDFFTCDFLREEIALHRTKLLKLTKLKTSELDELQQLVFTHIQFLNGSLIPKPSWLYAEKIIGQVDAKDNPFVALSHHLKARLWTGDKALINTLKSQSIKTIDSNRLLKSIQKL
jgi:predicted nucleic acid-binding protein